MQAKSARTSKIGKIAKGSLGPTFAGEEYQHAGSDVQKAPERGFEDATEQNEVERLENGKPLTVRSAVLVEGSHPTEIYTVSKESPCILDPKADIPKISGAKPQG